MPQFLTKQSSFHTAQFFVQWGNDDFSKNLRYSINGVYSFLWFFMTKLETVSSGVITSNIPSVQSVVY
jgi:hypothetical protein